METTQNLNVVSTVPLVTPREAKSEIPITEKAAQVVVASRAAVKNIISGQDPRFLAVIGPCSIHEEKAALEYALRLKNLAAKVADRIHITMRVYFEKPRTTIGWKGLINDPYMDGSFDIATGLRRARALLLAINEMGLSAGTEMLDPITPQYIADLVSWASIGARTTESQTHRQMASGLSMPVGFKNATDGNVQIAVDALQAAQHCHSFLGIDEDGRTCIVNTKGNSAGHLILRGGTSGPNYAAELIEEATQKLTKGQVNGRLIVDCSHANSSKDYTRQEQVWRYVSDLVAHGNQTVMGMMLESNLEPGNQKIPADLTQLKYGVSITDACIGWDKTEELVNYTYELLSQQLV
jgi:3-deoxy-7-phosphoheptulonate synthase